jgi:hypothetical protein
LLLAGCLPAAGTPSGQGQPTRRQGTPATLAPTYTPLATAVFAASPVSSATGAPVQPVSPAATLAVSRTPPLPPSATPCPRGPFFFEPAPGGCPAGPAQTTAAAEEAFEGGTMVWLQSADAITVLYNDRTWARYADLWSEGQPESDPAIVPPDGRFQPIRGFGKLWREQPMVRERLGWAVGVELAFQATLQEQAAAAGGLPVTFLRVFNDQVLVLTHRTATGGDWGVAAQP